ncbi:VWA domain-containing protein, partial [Amphritea sp. 1_MG-2023]|uniref:VWA domain-containing protein n=1 Tax=Amphritea sp. 1_MG-2023 TaxID=3062670 RepID=UPI0026E2B69B
GTPDDDTPSFSVDSVSISEGGLMTFTVSRSGDAEADQSVNFATSIATGDSAEVDDFTANSGTLTFVAGETSKTFTVQTNQDDAYEGGETFTVALDSPTGGAVISATAGTGTGTILDDDEAPNIVLPAAVSVSEEGLAGGLVDNTGDPEDTTDSATVTGTLYFTDTDSSVFDISLTGPLTSVSSGDVPVDSWMWDAASSTLTGSTSTGLDVMTIELSSVTSDVAGHSVDYSVTLLAPVDHPVNNTEDIMNLQFGVTVSDGANSTDSVLSVNIEDDRPVSGDLASTLEVPLASSNVMLILDFSGSMSGDNLTDMKAAVISMLDSYDASGYTAVQIVNFSTSASVVGDGGWISVADAKDYINNLTNADMGGWTNYDEALAAAETAFSETTGYISGGKNISYFLSDGEPTSGDDTTGIDATEQAAWETFVTDNNIDSIAVGFGGAEVTDLEPISYNGIDGTERDAIDATDAGSSLVDELLATVPVASSGNLFGTLSDGGFGADGNGQIRTVTIDSVTYSYDAETGLITNTANSDVISGNSLTISTAQGGELTLNMSTGSYEYVTDAVFTSDYEEVIGFTIQDTDGDVSSGVVTLDIMRETRPVPTLNANTDDVFEADMASGTNSDGSGEIATGNILADDTIPSGISLSNVTIDGGTTVVNGNEITVTTADGNTLVVDSATGDYTYTLVNAVDHAEYTATGNTITLASDTFSGSVDDWGGTNAVESGNRLLIDGSNDTATKLFDFGSAYANQTVTVAFDFEASSNWDGGNDNFVVTVNGTEVINDTSEGGSEAYSFDITLDDQGQADFELLNSSSRNNEDAYIDNFTITGPEFTATLSDTVVDSFTYEVSDLGGATYSSTLDITVHDDTPVVNNHTLDISVNVPESLISNVLLILDFSGSMRGTNLTDMQAAIITMLDAYAEAGDTAVQIVNFSSSASIASDSGWVSVDDAKAYVNALTDADMGGYTNYDAALATAQTAFAETTGYLTGGKNVSYFLSDGEPTSGDGTTGIDTTEEAEWEAFVTANQIDSYAVGFGGAAVTDLEPIAYNGIDATERDAIDATAAGASLTDELLATVDSAEGTLFASGINNAGILFGADGGHIFELTYDGVTYSYDAENPVQTIALSEGSMDLDFTTGNFTYTSSVHNNVDLTETFIISVTDDDGDQTLDQPLTMLIEKYQTTASAGDDRLLGTTGDDILDGLEGNDILIGGEGDDWLMGSAGADTFEWRGGDEGTIDVPASDHIQDFTVAEDKIDLSGLLDSLGLTSTGVVESYLSLTENSASETVLNVKESEAGDVVQEIVLDNVSLDSLKTDLSLDLSATNNDLLTQLIDQSKLIV